MFDEIKDILLFFAGVFSAYAAFALVTSRTRISATRQAEEILEQARKEGEVTVRELKSGAEIDAERKRLALEKELMKKRQELDELSSRLDRQSRELRLERGVLKRRELEMMERRQEADELFRTYRSRLEKESGLSKEDAVRLLKDEARSDCEDQIREMKSEILGKAEENLREEAKRIVVDTLQRFSSVAPSEVTATLVKLPSEEMKGRIIGREGRNIHSFEACTGTTLMIDETPETVLISSFDPVRREIARRALDELMKDGRIHPASIEASVEKAEAEIQANVHELGEEAVNKLKIMGLDSEIIELLGRLHFYLSNNQRTLEHSVEVAFFCSIMASEIGLNPDLAKRAGLLHDLGKALSHEYENSHARAAAMLLKGHGEVPVVVNAVEASHGEVPPSSPYAVLVQVADSLSSTRPGARNETMESYIQRVRNLEQLALSFDGVKDVYALKAGREIRIVVMPEKVTDQQASVLARRVRQRIENDLTYPGTIKVTIIRERRYTETAT